jgi:hypothetical protein
MGSLRVVVCAMLAPLLPAQLFVVDPLGGGTHVDLQAAINAAPAGAVIHVRGGVWGPLLVTRTLTIVGEGTPRIRSTFSGLGAQPPAIRLQGTGTETAVLAGLDVSGNANGAMWNAAGPGVSSSGFRRVAIHHCTVRGHDWTWISGTATGASAIVVADGATLQIAHSLVAASRGYPGANDTWAPPGAAAIAAAASAVVLLGTTVTGGAVDPMVWTMGSPWPTPCPCGPPGSEPGRGGAGVVAYSVHVAAGAITGGTGSPVIVNSAPFGNQPDGPPLVASVVTWFAATLVPLTPLRLGTVHTLGFAATTAPTVLAVGTPLPWPASIAGIQFVFVDLAQPVALHSLPAGATSWSLPVPASATLLGLELVEQRFDPSPSGTWLATNPVLAVVLP